MQIVVGLYPTVMEGEAVMRELQTAGFSRNDITMIQRDRKREGAAYTHELADDLAKRGASPEDAEIYAEGINRGSVLVTVKAEDRDTGKAAAIMGRHKAADIEKHAQEWRAAGWRPRYAAPVEPAPAEARPEPGVREGEYHIPVVEEQIRVGKRVSAHPGIRVYRHVTARPVEEKIRLTEERARVERRPADRPLTAAEREAAFREETIEIPESGEEPVVEKQARIVEDVVIGKEKQEREATIRDTVRRSDVEVQRMAAGATRPTVEYDEDFRSDFETRYAGRGLVYADYEPAYRFGVNYSADERYTEWTTLEPVARRDWEARGGRIRWEDSKGAVRYGWERGRRARP